MKRSRCLFFSMVMICSGLQAQEKPALRFQLELYGGFGTANPEDLNLALDAEQEFNFFNYNEGYFYLERIGYIDSFSYTRRGDYRKIKNVMPFGFRVRANFGSTLAFSLGMKSLTRTRRSFPKEEFTVIENSGSVSRQDVEYSPLLLKMSGLSYYAGVHVGRDLGRRFRIEGFLAAGPLSGEFLYSYALTNNYHYGDSGVTLVSEISQELRGKGKGFALDGGVQIFVNLNDRFRFFLMGTGSDQRVKSLSGPGWLNSYGYPEQWAGEIYLIKEPQSAPWSWGYNEITSLSNNEVLLKYFKARKMRLDLSGSSISIGIAFRL